MSVSLIITCKATVPQLKGIGLNREALADCMLEGWYAAGPHGSLTGSRDGSGRTANQLGNPRNIEILRSPDRITAIGTVPGPYAAIQNEGGIIPIRSARRFKVMRYTWGGMTHWSSTVGPSLIRGKHYIQAGLRICTEKKNMILEAIWVTKEIK